jgi:choline kinase
LIKQDILLLESDLIYESRALSALLNSDGEDQILISGKTDSGDEVYVEAYEGRITGLSKDQEFLKNVAGELVGISKFSKSFCLRMFREAEKMFTESLMVEYEQCVVKTGDLYPVYFLKIEDLIWAEIDDENHLARVKEEVLPHLNIKSM